MQNSGCGTLKISFEIIRSVTFRVCVTAKAFSKKHKTLYYILKFNANRTASVSVRSFKLLNLKAFAKIVIEVMKLSSFF